MAKKRKTKLKVKKSKTKKVDTTNRILKYFIWILLIVVLALILFSAKEYFNMLNKNQEKHITKAPLISEKTTKDITKKLKEVLKNNKDKYITPNHEVDDKASPPKKIVKREVKVVSNKPKLAIIIDDVCTRTQVRKIHNLGIKVNMSFLPPSSARPNSAKLASKERFYMVHLPMEAMHFNAEEPLTLKVHDSKNTIEKRIKELKRLFPKVKYINNHTGSKFTANEQAMNRLIYVLNKEDIFFIDSRTTGRTKVPKVMKNYGLKYMARDVFLDNRQDKKYIQKQIKKAIKVAKRHGSAIAICHPHSTTLKTLKESKYLFKDVELVLIDKLY